MDESRLYGEVGIDRTLTALELSVLLEPSSTTGLHNHN